MADSQAGAAAGARADDSSVISRALDYGFYAPIGLALSIADEIPKLAERGRERASGRMHLARVVGKYSVKEGRRRLERLLDSASGRPSRREASPSAGRPAADEPGPASKHAGALAGEGIPSEPVVRVETAAPRPAAGGTPAGGDAREPAAADPGDADRLAIPGYDTLAASQVVQRLSALTPEELEAIRHYEVATRGRRTILHRIAQLATDR